MSDMFVCSQLPTPCHFVALHAIRCLLPIFSLLLLTSILVRATFLSIHDAKDYWETLLFLHLIQPRELRLRLRVP
jgi:hypothetical protein